MDNNFYLAVVLDKESTEKLKQEIKPRHPKIFYHHMTVAYKPTEDVFKKYQDYIDKNIRLRVIKHCSNEKGQAVLIDTELSENKFPHITLSCSEGTKPVYSNNLFEESGICEDFKINLEGKLELINL